MRRTLPMLLLLALTACQSGPDRASPPPPLPEKVVPRTYAELLVRVRHWANFATDAHLVDDWAKLEDAGKGLDREAQFLVKADDVPAKHRDTLAVMSADLRKLSKDLLSAATAKDVKLTTTVLTRINTKVREMRLAD